MCVSLLLVAVLNFFLSFVLCLDRRLIIEPRGAVEQPSDKGRLRTFHLPLQFFFPFPPPPPPPTTMFSSSLYKSAGIKGLMASSVAPASG